MVKEYIINFYRKNMGAVIGAIIGLAMSVLILTIGLGNTLFIAVFVCVGCYFGSKISNDKDYIKRLLDRILPPGKYR